MLGAAGVVRRENPVLDFRSDETRPGALFTHEQRKVAGKQNLARAQLFEGAVRGFCEALAEVATFNFGR